MTALIIIGCILLFFVFLLSLKATITIAYSDELTLKVRVLGISIRILPKKEKKGPRSMSKKKAERIREKERKKAKKKREAALAKEEEKRKRKEEAKGKKKKSMSEILDTITMVRSIASEVIRRFFRHLRIDVARVHVKVATGDAATTAVAYGAACTALNILLPVLSEVKNFSLPDEKDFSVEPDFLGDTPTLDVKISFSLRVWHVLHVGLGALSKYLGHQAKSQTPPTSVNHKYK